MQTGILVPNDADDLAAFAVRAERLGYDAVWTGELWGRDSFVALTRAAYRTETVQLGTAIVNVYGRSPATIAQAAATLDDAADGRFTLGLGTSTRKVVEDLHGESFDNPARQLHEAVELTKQFLGADGRVSYEGKSFDVADFPSLSADVPVYAAALGPATRRATGRTADGWLPHNIPFERLGEAFETIAETASAAGRDPQTITTMPYVPSAASADPDRARAAVRGHLAYYVGSGEGYRRAVAESFPHAADAIAEAWRSGDREEARGAVTDEMLDALGVAGTPEQARDRLAEIAALDAVDVPLVVVPDDTGDELRRETMEALAPEE
ncbi:Flavin-dependent oxidoreductase, luciferase family (includes alkanesulfonate monooxygenase SsuD and methylene tetrahydromethanopterin reductase) [Halovenus aranensis]|uniref:Flavin-dependent oxidoreductase, luciferase family (Includes alkanesulfonate monooxygenase SsuD and methylene tetrahydromethanopterin reductase) n=1 Tax=Halovenus aranensis TaxID=890420 RepID=A0A1G8WMY1_9EURY|nr:LLM class flavin-dependent oxidoreductase [Halovenus aranensis]SDJ79748.1 Flavin-dependent oxidoreductase, luciferase family (includes alkanesulfonate monooxygenase SsuD and methylene tetrahydromethanopterin reductase) [Halovenus aranensis]